MTRCHWPGSVSAKNPNSSVPALLTRIENGPWAATRSIADCGSVTSSGADVGADLGGELGRPVGVEVADHDLGALGGEPRRDRGADPAGAAGDQRPSALEPHRAAAYGRIHSRAVASDEAIPIIGGTGALGYGLALRWARAGRAVVIGSRSAERAAEAASEALRARSRRRDRGARERAGGEAGPVVFLTVPFRAQSENLNNLREALEPGQLLVDCTVPLAAAVSGKATRSLGVWQGSAAQQAQEMVPDGRHRGRRPAHGQRPDPRRHSAPSSTRTCSCAAIARPTRRGSRG